MKKIISILFLAITGLMMAQNKTLVTINGEKVIYNIGGRWGITGNTGLTAGTNFIGTTDDQDIVFKRSNSFAGLLNTSKSLTSLGLWSLYATSTGINNTALGTSSLVANTTGSRNTAIGASALSFNATGNGNTAIGDALLYSSGNNNTAVGAGALNYLGFGDNNTGIGEGSFGGLGGVTGSGNTIMGSSEFVSGSDDNFTGLSNNIIMYDAGNRRIRVDHTGKVGIGTGTADLSRKLEINKGTSAAAIKIVDGGEADGYILMSDGSGAGSWKPPIAPVLEVVRGVVAPARTALTTGATNNYVNSSIVLTQGKWIVNIGLLVYGRADAGAGTVVANSTYANRYTLSSSDSALRTDNFSFVGPNGGNNLVFNMVSIGSVAPRYAMFVDGIMRVNITNPGTTTLYLWNVQSGSFGTNVGAIGGGNGESYFYATKSN